jgi:ABC-type spermidine/putrescine transport system permease subunit I
MDKRMRSIVAIIGGASAVLLVFLGLEVMSDTSVEVWSQLNSLPLGFYRYVSDSYSHQMFWTPLVIAGVAAVIYFVRGVPPAKAG